MNHVYNIVIAVHGGAGVIRRADMTPEEETAYIKGVEDALTSGYMILEDGGDVLDAVEAAVVAFEDNPLFNAGRGSVFAENGRHEMDASIMYGRTLGAGAVANVRNVRNPIRLARGVMEQSGHVFLSGEGAEKFARQMNLTFEPDEYFFTHRRYGQLLNMRESGMGTVGSVALDRKGNLAAATSTGGLTNKKIGRIGDTPVIGAGTYANNRTCAVSCTGHGEYFIRSVAAHDVSSLMEYAGLSLKDSSNAVVKKIGEMGGWGGLIAVDSNGNIAMPFNSEGMFRGYRRPNDFYVAVY